MSAAQCSIEIGSGARCQDPVDLQAPLSLCRHHFLLAHEWVAEDAGLTDLLPSPCLACGSRLGVKYPSGWLCATCEWRVGSVPDHGLPEPRVDVVYYLRLGAQIKIGTSANPRRRISSVPHDEVLAFEQGDRLLEQSRHQRFASHRIPRTEWFHRNDELSAHIALISRGVADPWSRYDRWRSEALALRG